MALSFHNRVLAKVVGDAKVQHEVVQATALRDSLRQTVAQRKKELEGLKMILS